MPVKAANLGEFVDAVCFSRACCKHNLKTFTLVTAKQRFPHYTGIQDLLVFNMAPSLAALTVYAFGATSFLAGIVQLINPPARALESTRCWSAEDGNALAAIAMGIYYTISAYQENRTFFLATIPMRSLTTFVFWRHGRIDVAVWEGLGAFLTAASLMVMNRRVSGSKRAE